MVEAAVCAMRQTYEVIVDSSLDPIQFSIKLYSAGLISTSTHRSVIDTTSIMNKRDRMCLILNELLCAISFKGMLLFDSVLECLKSLDGLVCESIVEKLQTAHKEMVCDSCDKDKAIVLNSHQSVSCPSDSLWSLYSSFLKAMYSRRLDAYDQWPPVHTNEYIPVVLKEVTSLDTEDVIKRKTQQILAGKINESINHLFTDEVMNNCFTGKRASTILIEGAPGIGKTAFSYSICQKWASYSALHRFKAVIRWSLSDLMDLDVSFISDLVIHDSPNVKDEIVKALCDESGNDVLFVFDGWDEISENTAKEKVNFLLDLIKGKKLPKASHIVTTRSLQSNKSFKLKRNIFDYCYEITGFSDENIVEYIQKAFTHKPEDARLLLKQLEFRPDIHSMCYIPIHCAIVAYVFLQKRKLPRTITEFYQIFIVNSLLRNMQLRVEGGNEIDELASLSDLPKTIFALFVKLSELAFRGLWTCRHSYSEDEVQAVASSTTCKIDQLGVLQAQRIFHAKGTKLSFHFLHSSVQQFLAAYFLTSLTCEEQRKYIDTYINYLSFYSVWQFFCGLSSFSQLQHSGFVDMARHSIKDLKKADHEICLDEDEGLLEPVDFSVLNLDTPSLSSDDDNERQEEGEEDGASNIAILQAPRLLMDSVSSSVKVKLPYGSFSKRLLLLFLKCAYESKSSFLIEFILSLCEQNLQFRNYSLNKLDMIPIGFLLRNVKGNFQLKLESCHLRSDHLLVFRQQIMLTKRSSLSVNKIFLQNNNMSIEGAHELSKLLPILKNCETLDISSNKIHVEGLQYISKTLCHLSCLKEFDLSNNNLDSIEGLCKAVCNLKHLTYLNLSNNPFDSKSASQLTEVLKSCCELRHLTLAKSSISDEGISIIAEGIAIAQNLTSLNLQDCGISETGAAYLSTVLGDSPIKELKLTLNNIGIGGADLIFSSLSSNSLLQCLDVSECSISCNDSLLESLNSFLTSTSLKKLNLSYNPLQDEGLASVLSILINNSCSLEDLDISGSNMQVLASVALGDTLLTPHSKLTHITLSGTECSVVQVMHEDEFQYLLESMTSSSALETVTFNISEEMRSDVSEYITYIEELRSDNNFQELTFQLVVCEESANDVIESEEEWLVEDEED